MEIKTAYSLQHLTTFAQDVSASQYVAFYETSEIYEFLSTHSLAGQKYLVLGGGSNLLFVNDYEGIILHPCMTGIEMLAENSETVRVKVMAGERWDDFVSLCVANGWARIENLSLIPGNVGASAVQNIGAYGVEAKDTIESVEAIDLATGERRVVPAEHCGFGYRESHFKNKWKNRFVITAVNYRLRKQAEFTLSYPGVARELNRLGAPSLANVRQAIINIRRKKLPDPSDLGNAGCFFKNPMVDADVFNSLKGDYPELPHYAGDEGRVKLPAGWLVEKCGWKEKALGQAGVYQHQALVIVNYGRATGVEIYELSEKIRDTVHEKFGVDLEREVQVIA